MQSYTLDSVQSYSLDSAQNYTLGNARNYILDNARNYILDSARKYALGSLRRIEGTGASGPRGGESWGPTTSQIASGPRVGASTDDPHH